MSKFELKETSIPMAFVGMMATAVERIWEPADTSDFYECLCKSIGDFLGQNKSKSGKVAIRFQDSKGPMKMAAVVSYIPATTEGDEGNWDLRMTFNEADLEGVEKQYTICDTEWQRMIENTTHNMYRMLFDRFQTLHGAQLVAVDCLVNWMDQNAKEGEEMTIELGQREGTSPVWFECTVGIENGEKLMSITPGGTTKGLIKCDADLEVV